MDGTVSPGPQAAAGDDGTRRAPIDEALAPYEEALRAQLPGLDEILAAAAARRQRGRQRKRLAAGGTALAMAVLVAWLDPAYKTEQFATAVGQRATWTLQDGSELRLNTGSRVTSSLHLRSRRFTIEQGEASFAVAHAPWHGLAPRAERSFTVRAGPVLVEDIGTVFNVRLRSADEALVTVLHGRVRVSRPLAEGEAARELASGDSLLGRPGGFDTPSAGEAAQAAAWRDGRLLFDDMPLRAVVAELQRYRPAPLRLAPGVDGGLRISGQFDIEHVEQLIGLLPSLAPVRLRSEADGALRIEPAH